MASKFSNLEAGIGGEERVENALGKNPLLPDHRIFYDLSLSSSEKFQIDTLFLTPSYGIVFEVKNISGKLFFFKENPPQLIRIRENGQADGFDCPAEQAERNRFLLDMWLQSKGIQLPLLAVVILAYPKQIVEIPPKKTKVLFPSLIPSFIRNLPQRRERLDPQTFERLCADLVNSHRNYIPDPICLTYNIPRFDIQTGVQCKACSKLGMVKLKKGWHCPACGHICRSAHERAIRDWFLLFGGKMTNRDCREFLHVDIDTASRLLKNMDLIVEGTFKNRTYRMNFENL